MENKNRYLTDEELSCLIEQVEKKELMSAPSYLEEKILRQVQREQQKPAKHIEITTVGKSGSMSRYRLLTYSMEIMAGAAAAIALLVMIPGMSESTITDNHAAWVQEQTAEREQYSAGKTDRSNAVFDSVNEITSRICNGINERTNAVFQKEEK